MELFLIWWSVGIITSYLYTKTINYMVDGDEFKFEPLHKGNILLSIVLGLFGPVTLLFAFLMFIGIAVVKFIQFCHNWE